MNWTETYLENGRIYLAAMPQQKVLIKQSMLDEQRECRRNLELLVSNDRGTIASIAAQTPSLRRMLEEHELKFLTDENGQMIGFKAWKDIVNAIGIDYTDDDFNEESWKNIREVEITRSKNRCFSVYYQDPKKGLPDKGYNFVCFDQWSQDYGLKGFFVKLFSSEEDMQFEADVCRILVEDQAHYDPVKGLFVDIPKNVRTAEIATEDNPDKGKLYVFISELEPGRTFGQCYGACSFDERTQAEDYYQMNLENLLDSIDHIQKTGNQKIEALREIGVRKKDYTEDIINYTCCSHCQPDLGYARFIQAVTNSVGGELNRIMENTPELVSFTVGDRHLYNNIVLFNDEDTFESIIQVDFEQSAESIFLEDYVKIATKAVPGIAHSASENSARYNHELGSMVRDYCFSKIKTTVDLQRTFDLLVLHNYIKTAHYHLVNGNRDEYIFASNMVADSINKFDPTGINDDLKYVQSFVENEFKEKYDQIAT